jgi:hypothetical protein
MSYYLAYLLEAIFMMHSANRISILYLHLSLPLLLEAALTGGWVWTLECGRVKGEPPMVHRVGRRVSFDWVEGKLKK